MTILRVVTGIRVERRLVTLPPGSTVGAAVCEDDPDDCCLDGGSGGGSGSGSGGSGGGSSIVSCCANPISDTLYATFSDGSNFACATGSVALTLLAAGTWGTTGIVAFGSCGRNINLTLTCSAAVWNLAIAFSDICVLPGDVNPTSEVCLPLSLVFSISTSGACGATGSPSSFTITITE